MALDSHDEGQGGTTIPVVPVAPRLAGMKSRISFLPGVMVGHRLLKNARYWSDSRRTTTGKVKRARLTVEQAVDYTESIFRKIDGVLQTQGGWSGKRVLEIGPGDSLGTGLWCLGSGAASYTAIDRFAVTLDRAFEEQVLAAIGTRLGRVESALDIDWDGLPKANEAANRIFSYRNDLPVEAAPGVLGRASYDVIFSNAVLEHVGDLMGTLSAMQALLAPGGVMFHDVDLRSHQTYEKHPIQFLEYPAILWKLMSSHNGEPNRFRMPRYLNALADLGFSGIDSGVTRVFDRNLVESRHRHLAAEFRCLSIDDLLPAVFWFSCTK